MDSQPPKYVSPPGTWKTKLGLRALSILFMITLAGLGGSLATTPRVDMMAIMLVILVPAIIVTFSWDTAEGICILKRGGNRGIHPGAVVAIDLFAWLGWAVVTLFVGAVGLISRPRYMIDDYSGYSDSRYGYDPSKVTPEDAALEKEITGKGRAMVALVIFTAIIHFALFVIACYETNVRNRMPRTVYVMQPMYGASPVIPGGYQSLDAQGQPMAGQMPAHPPATHAPETKSQRFA